MKKAFQKRRSYELGQPESRRGRAGGRGKRRDRRAKAGRGHGRTAAGWQVRAQWPWFNSGKFPTAGQKRYSALLTCAVRRKGALTKSGDQLAGIADARGIEAGLDAAQRRQPRRAVEFGQSVALHLSAALFGRNRTARTSVVSGKSVS